MPGRIRVVLNGEPLPGTFPTEDDARAALVRAMHDRYDLVPAES